MNKFAKLKYLALLDWKKFKSNTTALALLGIYCFLAPFAILWGKEVFKDMPAPMPRAEVFYEFPTVWEYQGYVGNWLVSFLLGFLIIYIITSEVSNRTMRQNIITGLTKVDFFVSKLITLFVIAIAVSLVYGLSTIIIGIIHTDGYDLELILDNNNSVLKFFLMTVGYLSFAMMLSYLVRKGTLTILIYFFYVLMLEPILMLIHVYYIRNESRNYWPMNTFEDLHPNPMLKLPNFFVNNDWKFSILHTQTTAISMTIVYTAIFLGLSYWVFMKRDV